MKALCALETISFMSGPRQNASILAIIFVMTWIKLTGLNSKISSAPSFLARERCWANLANGGWPYEDH
jgi:hypothetical protein